MGGLQGDIECKLEASSRWLSLEMMGLGTGQPVDRAPSARESVSSPYSKQMGKDGGHD